MSINEKIQSTEEEFRQLQEYMQKLNTEIGRIQNLITETKNRSIFLSGKIEALRQVNSEDLEVVAE